MLWLPLVLACKPEPYAELREQGVDQYLGQVEPVASTEEDGIVSHRFDPNDGPQCLYGDEFHTMVRDQGHGNLVVFLQGGGLCTSDLCIAVTTGGPGIPTIDILDPDLAINPVASWDHVYVPYCDGSLFGGDVQIDDDGDGSPDRIHHGLRNLSAAMDVAKSMFPAPSRVLVAGSSGGGYGTLPAAVLARWSWPDTELLVFNDAGIGLGMDRDPTFIWSIIEEFHAERIVPASQSHLLDGGHLSPLVGWQLDEDPNLRVSAFSTLQDYVISQIYLGVESDDFESWLVQEVDALHSRHPERYQSFIADGTFHTTLLGDPSGFLDADSAYTELLEELLGGMDETAIDSVTVADWMDHFLDEDVRWISLRD